MLSVDPGSANFGSVVLDPNARTLADSLLMSSCRPIAHTSSEVAQAAGVLHLIRTQASAYQCATLIVEGQAHTQRMRGIQQAAVTAGLALGLQVHLVQPRSVKAWLRSLDVEIGGREASYAQNKRRAKEVCAEAGFPQSSHHEADALLQGLYALAKRLF